MTRKHEIRVALADAVKTACASKGLANSLPYFPRAIQDAELPLSVVALRTGTFDWETYGAEQMVEDRTFEILVHVARGTLGQEGVSEAECDDYGDLLIDYFGTHRVLRLTSGLEVFLTPTGDTGTTVFEYGDPRTRLFQFLGVTMPISVEIEKTFEQVN